MPMALPAGGPVARRAAGTGAKVVGVVGAPRYVKGADAVVEAVAGDAPSARVLPAGERPVPAGDQPALRPAR